MEEQIRQLEGSNNPAVAMRAAMAPAATHSARRNSKKRDLSQYKGKSIKEAQGFFYQDWSRICFRPRAMKDVACSNMSNTILGKSCHYPVFITPIGLVGMAHSDAELGLVLASKRRGIHCCVSTATTLDHKFIATGFDLQGNKSRQSYGAVFFQLYVHSQRSETVNRIRTARKLGYSALFITVDTPVIGKRVDDRRLQAAEMSKINGGVSTEKEGVQGGRAPSGALSQTLVWEDLVWIREEWPGPIVIKGVQSAEDAKSAMQAGAQGIYLSNHGGRQLRSAPSSLDTLLEIRFKYPEILNNCEVFVDGGFRHGADVVKALCLGAKAVGIGRPFLYALAAFGTEGVERAIDSKLIYDLVFFSIFF
jgi:L-lactate dehydrogenase (cytochrome)